MYSALENKRNGGDGIIKRGPKALLSYAGIADLNKLLTERALALKALHADNKNKQFTDALRDTISQHSSNPLAKVPVPNAKSIKKYSDAAGAIVKEGTVKNATRYSSFTELRSS
jgi:hypothetical protein